MIDKFWLKSTILDEQVVRGRTIIEKSEGAAELPRYAILLFAPDDLGRRTIDR
jgi:predicted nucleotide-binding protein